MDAMTAVALIGLHDQTIATLRASWLAARADEARKWMESIDAALDQRLRLMEVRDGAQ